MDHAIDQQPETNKSTVELVERWADEDSIYWKIRIYDNALPGGKSELTLELLPYAHIVLIDEQ